MEKIKTIIIDAEEVSTELTLNYLKEIEEIEVCAKFQNIKDSFNDVVILSPSLVIVDISEKTPLALDYLNRLTKAIKGVKIVALSYDTASETAIKALRAGAKEFLIKPLIEEEFINAVKKTKDLILGNINDSTKCKVITSFSNKGGIGKTSVAVNLAYELALQTNEKVALVDLNFQLGDITTFLDLNPSFDAAYVIDNLARIDEDFLLSSMEKYKDTSLYVLADPPNLERSNDITKENITTLINVLRNVFSYVIVDTTSAFDDKTIAALDNSDLILFVLIPNLPSIRNAQRCLDMFKKLGYDKDKIKLIVNRFMENDEIKPEYVEHTLDHSIYHKIPNNYFTIINAVNKGVTLAEVNRRSNIAKAFYDLAANLSDNYTYSLQKPANREDFSFLGLFKKKEKN